jgi:hypothetical protein
MVLKMSLGLVMAMPIPLPGAEPTLSDISATTDRTTPDPGDKHHQVHQQVLVATSPDCHRHATSHHEVNGHTTSPPSVNTDSHCGDSIDCHHCCAIGLGREPGNEQQTAPATHPTSPPQDWQNANLQPVLRPPIA